MNPFSACIKQQPIRLSAEDEGEEHDDHHHHHHSTRHRNCGLGWPFTTCLLGTTGRIQLPDDAAADDLLDDYLDPNTTVGIEPLLAQHAIPDNQGEDDDDDDDEDDNNNNKSFMKHDMFNEPHRFLSRNPFATTSSSSGILGSTDFYDEDAQFLSDRRISDVLEQNQEQDDGKEEKEDNGMDKDEEFGQELVDVVRPPQSTKELDDWTQMDQKEDKEMADTTNTTTTHAAESSLQNTTTSTFVASSIQPTTRTTSLTAKEESTTATTPISNNDFPILGLPRTQVVAPTPIPAATALNKPATTTTAEDEALLLPPPSPPTPVPETTVTTDDLLPLETEQQQHPLDTQQQQPVIPLTESTAQKSPVVLPADATYSQVDDGNSNNNKRTSVAATMAQSILGDRLEDFTEKLAFIKKNIIMSLEDEENMDEEDRVLKPSFSETNRRRTSFDPLVKPTRERSTPPVMQQQQQQRQHKRSSSLMDVASPAIARFLNQMSGEGNGEDRGGSFSPSSFFASLAAPESHESSDNNTEAKRHDPLLARQRPPRVASPSILPLQEEDEEGQDDEEELFDFNKMFTLGKSVFNDVANRVKNANKQQQQQQQQQQQADEQGNDNWIIDRQAWI